MARASRWQLLPYDVAFVAPVRTAQGTWARREGAFVRVTDVAGGVGLGELAPLPAWGTESLAAGLRALAALPALDFSSPEEVALALVLAGLDARTHPAAFAAAELACLDLLAQERGLPLAGLWGEGRAAVRVNGLVGAVAPAVAAARARELVDLGYRTLKLKLADDGEDLARLGAVRAEVGPAIALRLDANGAWGLEQARRQLEAFAPFLPEYIEQPVSDFAALAALAREGVVPVAADEALHQPGGLEAALAAGVQAVVLKPLALGGLGAALAATRLARAAGVQAVWSSVMDRGVGVAGAVHALAALGEMPAAGLATAGLFAGGAALAGLEPVGGAIALPEAPGLGFEPRVSELAASYSPPAARQIPSELALAPTLHAARLHPERLALRVLGVSLTHRELEARVVATAASLASLGVRAGTVVGLWGTSSLAWVVAFHAVARLDAVALLLSARLADPELADLLARGEATWLLADAERLARAAALESGVAVLALEALPPASLCPLPTAHAASTPLLRVPTSGSSGRPKIVELSRGAVEASARAVNLALALAPQDRWWGAMPLWHVGGLGVLWRASLAGAAVLLETRFDPRAFLRDTELSDGPTVASFVPTMLEAVLDALGPAPWPARLRAAMLGGAPVSAALVARCPVALPTYGLTEASSTVTLAPLDPDPARRGGSGLPVGQARVRVLTPAGEAAPGTPGRIHVASPTLFTRYVGDPEATSRTLADGWLDTGDVGHLDDAGRLHVAGRHDELIVTGGENVYPAEIEQAIAAHPEVLAVAVVGVPHPRWGMAPFALVVWRGAPLPLEAHLTPLLARFKHPRGYRAVQALPLLANGKPDRVAIRALALEGAALPGRVP